MACRQRTAVPPACVVQIEHARRALLCMCMYVHLQSVYHQVRAAALLRATACANVPKSVLCGGLEVQPPLPAQCAYSSYSSELSRLPWPWSTRARDAQFALLIVLRLPASSRKWLAMHSQYAPALAAAAAAAIVLICCRVISRMRAAWRDGVHPNA